MSDSDRVANLGEERKRMCTVAHGHHDHPPSDGSTLNEDITPRITVKTFLAVLAQGQTIAGHFNDRERVSWFSATITILTVVLGPPISQATDYWGRKWFLVVLTLAGGVGSVIVATATSMNMCIAGFCVIGIAFGAQPLLHAITSEVLPRRWRGHGQAANMVSNALGSITGLLVGGALNRTNDIAKDGFRAYFYMATGWYVAAAVLCIVAYNPPPTEKQREFRGRTLDKLRKLDWIGYFLLAAGLILFCLGLSWSKAPYPWSDPHVSATFCVGLLLALLLVVYAIWIKKDGMFHHGLFTGNRNFSIALFCVFAEGVAFFAANTYFAFQVSVLYEKDALLVGARYSIMLIASMVGAASTGLYCAKTRRVRWVTVLAFAIFVAFFACMASTNRHTDAPVWGYPVLLGLALGMTLTTLITVGQLSTPPELIATASGLIISVRSLGGTIGIAIYNALFQDQMRHQPRNIGTAAVATGLEPEYVPDFITALTAHNRTALDAVSTITDKIIDVGNVAYLDTYVVAFRHVWVTGGAFVVLALVASIWLYDPEKEFNNAVDASLERRDVLIASEK
ncbi:siderophore iron transporter [Emericellopsis cladophorae]|uniref:Siderophore iron transporter n=1 Tax=Emericellopsis cladophorae TaxID=2686198 RepID=A0A9P9Y010_9HYPO|nr:siderophore iron transporter [Emericellopsis cladophorae]KAI6780835.1 siderophore iron transporter [Emericellopsis cladophorae]